MTQATITHEMINNYLDAKEKVWSAASYNSERARLRANIEALNQPPLAAYDALKTRGIAPYTIKTLFIRFASFYKYLLSTSQVVGPNPWQLFLEENPQVFRNVYEKEVVPCSFKEAKARIEKIVDPKVRAHANYMLNSGLRIHETYKIEEDIDGSLYVLGKGGKKRKVFMRARPKYIVPEHTLRRALSKINLKPHSLRKLLATELFNRDFKAPELCKVLGWSKLETAMSYLQSKNDADIMAAMDRDGSENSSDLNPDFQHPHWWTKEDQTHGGKIGPHEVEERRQERANEKK